MRKYFRSCKDERAFALGNNLANMPSAWQDRPLDFDRRCSHPVNQAESPSGRTVTEMYFRDRIEENRAGPIELFRACIAAHDQERDNQFIVAILDHCSDSLPTILAVGLWIHSREQQEVVRAVPRRIPRKAIGAMPSPGTKTASGADPRAQESRQIQGVVSARSSPAQATIPDQRGLR